MHSENPHLSELQQDSSIPSEPIITSMDNHLNLAISECATDVKLGSVANISDDPLLIVETDVRKDQDVIIQACINTFGSFRATNGMLNDSLDTADDTSTCCENEVYFCKIDIKHPSLDLNDRIIIIFH